MLCPFCLDDAKFEQKKIGGNHASIYLCPQCNEQVPALYSQDYKEYSPVVISAVGFRQHGKTVYFASLFYTLKKLTLARDWPDFFTMGLNEDSLDTVYSNAHMLQDGALPDSTPKNFPRPTMLRAEGLPMHPNCTLLFFDTGGECFERPTQLVQFAGFVRRAKAVMLLISLADLDDPRAGMQQLLNTYIVGMGELGTSTKEQHLIVVFTKADRIAAKGYRLPTMNISFARAGSFDPDLGESVSHAWVGGKAKLVCSTVTERPVAELSMSGDQVDHFVLAENFLFGCSEVTAGDHEFASVCRKLHADTLDHGNQLGRRRQGVELRLECISGSRFELNVLILGQPGEWDFDHFGRFRNEHVENETRKQTECDSGTDTAAQA